MTDWTPRADDLARPAYRSLARAIAGAITDGRLRSGQRLPPHREMAARLGLSVQTVTRAYESLIRADLISAEVGRGTFVRPTQPDPEAAPWDRAAGGSPPLDLSLMTPVRLPQIAEAWRESLHRVTHRLNHDVAHALRPRELSRHYGAIAATWLALSGPAVEPDRLLVTNGLTPAMHAALSAVAGPGDAIATDDVTSHMLKPAARQLSLRLQGIPGDERGMLPEALTEAARNPAEHMKAVFLLPSGGGPRATVIDSDRRAALARAAADAGLFVLECDPLGPLAGRHIAPVASFAPERSFYFTTLTKCLSPGLRFGILTMPGALAARTHARHQAIAWSVTPLIGEIAADWIGSGMAERLVLAQRAELAQRNRLADRLLGPQVTRARHALHRWLTLPEGVGERAFLRLALQNDVAVAGGSGFVVTDTRPAIRVCLGAPGRTGLERALSTLAALLKVRA